VGSRVWRVGKWAGVVPTRVYGGLLGLWVASIVVTVSYSSSTLMRLAVGDGSFFAFWPAANNGGTVRTSSQGLQWKTGLLVSTNYEASMDELGTYRLWVEISGFDSRVRAAKRFVNRAGLALPRMVLTEWEARNDIYPGRLVRGGPDVARELAQARIRAGLPVTPVVVRAIRVPIPCLILGYWILRRLGGASARVGTRRRNRRIRSGCCVECGYDLTKNESGICPECGVGIRGAEGKA